MQATLTGLKYIIHIQEPLIASGTIKISIHKIDRDTYKVEPCPAISVLTDVDKFARALYDHYERMPFPHLKGELVE